MNTFTITIYLTSGILPVVLNGVGRVTVDDVAHVLDTGGDLTFTANNKSVRVRESQVVQVVVDPAP